MIEERQAGDLSANLPVGAGSGRTFTAPALAARATGVTRGLLLAGAALLAGSALAQGAAPAKPNPAAASKIAQEVCSACHGADGNSTAPVNPKLASQHPDYLFKQLSDFKVKDGKKVAARPNAVMAAFVANLSDADMHNLAAFYSGQPLKPSAARNKDTVELGQAIYRAGIVEKGVPSCSGCHGPRGEGIPAQYPALHGQYSDYTEAQLTGFRSGDRHNNAPMAAIASRLSDAEIKAVADYIAGLR